jgi:hypothetical protein
MTVDAEHIRAVVAQRLAFRQAVHLLCPDIPDVEPRERRCHHGHLMQREDGGRTRCSEGCSARPRR